MVVLSSLETPFRSNYSLRTRTAYTKCGNHVILLFVALLCNEARVKNQNSVFAQAAQTSCLHTLTIGHLNLDGYVPPFFSPPAAPFSPSNILDTQNSNITTCTLLPPVIRTAPTARVLSLPPSQLTSLTQIGIGMHFAPSPKALNHSLIQSWILHLV